MSKSIYEEAIEIIVTYGTIRKLWTKIKEIEKQIKELENDKSRISEID